VGPSRELEEQREVSEDVLLPQLRDHAPAIDVAADDRVALVVRVVLGDGIDELRAAVGAGAVRFPAGEAGVSAVDVEEQRAFLAVPAVVAARNDLVDLLDVVLTDVPDVEVAVAVVEAEPIRVAVTVGPDLRHGPAHEWLSAGTRYCLPGENGGLTSMRWILPRCVLRFCALPLPWWPVIGATRLHVGVWGYFGRARMSN